MACARNQKLVLIAYVVVNVIVTAGFFAESLFLSKRYLIALSLVLMLWAPFALDKLLQAWSQRRQRGLLTVAVLLMLISAVGGIVRFGYSKAYIRQAGDWLATNVPAKAAIYGNDIQLMYYSGHFTNALFSTMPSRANVGAIAQDQWKQYDYLALRLDKKVGPTVAASLRKRGLQPIHVFSNKRGDYVAIYKVRS